MIWLVETQQKRDTPISGRKELHIHRPYQPQYGSLSVSHAGRRVWWHLSCFHVLCRNLCRVNRIADNHTTSCIIQLVGTYCMLANRPLRLQSVVKWLLLLWRAQEDSRTSNTAESTRTALILERDWDVFVYLRVRYHNCTFHFSTKAWQQSPDPPSPHAILKAIRTGVGRVWKRD